MPLYCLGLCEAVISHAAVVPVARDREVQHVGRHHPVVDDVGALRRGAVDERARRATATTDACRGRAQSASPCRYATNAAADARARRLR